MASNTRYYGDSRASTPDGGCHVEVDTQLKQALRDALTHSWRTLGFSLAAAVAGYGVLQVFASFVAPLAWAVVTGAALYQLKSLLVNVVLSWLSTLAPTQKTVVFKNRDADVQGTHAEYERRMATKAAILSASTFVSDRRPLVLGLLLVPFALLDTVAVQAHELVVTCKQTRWRVLLTVGVLVALSHRPIALVLLVDTVTYLRYVGTATLGAVGWYHEHGNAVSVALVATSLVGAATARLWMRHQALESAGYILGSVVVVLQLCRTATGFTCVSVFTAMLIVGWGDERRAIAKQFEADLKFNEVNRRLWFKKAGAPRPPRETNPEPMLILFRVAARGSPERDYIGARRKKWKEKADLLKVEWEMCQTMMAEQLFGVRVDEFDASDEQPSACLSIRYTGDMDDSSKSYPWPPPLVSLPEFIKLPVGTMDSLKRSGFAVIECVVSGGNRHMVTLWDEKSTPKFERCSTLLLRLNKFDLNDRLPERISNLAARECVWGGVHGDLEIVVSANQNATLKVGRTAFVLPIEALPIGGAVVAVPAVGEVDCMWTGGGNGSESLCEYADARLRKWYHMDWHLFSLLLSCVFVWFDAVWSVLIITAVCLALGLKWLVAYFEPNLQAGWDWAAAKGVSVYSTLLPGWFSTVFHRVRILYLRADAWLVSVAERQAHGFVAVLLIVGLMLVAVSSGTIIALNVHREGVTMVSSVRTYAVDAVNRSETLQSYLPSGDVVSLLVESGINSTYSYTRQYIADRGVSFFGPSFNFTEIEASIERLWYNSSNSTTVGGESYVELPIETVVRLALSGDLSGAYDNMQTGLRMGDDLSLVSAASNFVDLSLISAYVHRGGQNVQLGFNALWNVLKLVVGKSVVVGQFAVGVTTYLLALFYLLSKDRYTPMEKMSDCLPSEMKDQAVKQVYRTINSVFVVTWKMSSFHGCFMWLSLRIFLSREEFDEAVVVIPCIAAAIISIVPIMPSFFVAIPHTLGLWLNVNQSGESISAIESTAGLLDALLFFGLHFYVYYEISPRIYGSMHAGTPNFLVSMSVVGGIVYIGLSGAVVGPLILTGFVTTLELLRMHNRQGCSQPSA